MDSVGSGGTSVNKGGLYTLNCRVACFGITWPRQHRMSHAGASGDAERGCSHTARSAVCSDTWWEKLETKFWSLNEKSHFQGSWCAFLWLCDYFCDTAFTSSSSFNFFLKNVLLNSQFYQLKKTFLSISVLLSFMCEPVVRASALPLIHPAEETSPRPRAQWSSVSLSETMQQQQRRRQDATRGRHCFSPDRGTLLFVARLQRERPAKGLWHPLPETSPHRVYFWQEMTQSWEKTTTVWIHRQLVNILLPCA